MRSGGFERARWDPCLRATLLEVNLRSVAVARYGRLKILSAYAFNGRASGTAAGRTPGRFRMPDSPSLRWELLL